MAEKLQVYKCELCGNIVEVLHGGAGTLVCCGEEMKLYAENTVDAAKEKHVPSLEITNSGIKVSVGSVLHPMDEKHYIEFVELVTEDRSFTHFFKPGDTPVFTFEKVDGAFTVRAYCNLHGLWKNA